jgi:hypothetical protein
VDDVLLVVVVVVEVVTGPIATGTVAEPGKPVDSTTRGTGLDATWRRDPWLPKLTPAGGR